MLIKKKQAKREKISKNGLVYDYPMPSKYLGIATQELNFRIPDKGWYKNKICDEICYVISGSAILFIDDKKFNIKQGDIFIIKPKQKSYLQADNLKILTITRPNWYKEQCEILEEN